MNFTKILFPLIYLLTPAFLQTQTVLFYHEQLCLKDFGNKELKIRDTITKDEILLSPKKKCTQQEKIFIIYPQYKSFGHLQISEKTSLVFEKNIKLYPYSGIGNIEVDDGYLVVSQGLLPGTSIIIDAKNKITITPRTQTISILIKRIRSTR